MCSVQAAGWLDLLDDVQENVGIAMLFIHPRPARPRRQICDGGAG